MQKIESRIILTFILSLTLILFNACTSEENSVIEENQVISKENFELLKANALNEYNRNDFSKVTNPTPNTVNYEEIVEILNNEGQQQRSADFDYSDYESILGEYYDEEYFNQLSSLYEYSENIIQSDLFNENSTIQERESYLAEILEYVIVNDQESSIANRSSNCQGHLNVCEASAERTLGITIAGCTAGSVVAAIFTGGAGAAAWPVCMATAGFHYDNNMQTCQEHYEVCTGQ